SWHVPADDASAHHWPPLAHGGPGGAGGLHRWPSRCVVGHPRRDRRVRQERVNEQHVAHAAREMGLGVAQVRATAELLGEGATVPFVARYRKEATGSLDEVAITAIRDRLAQLAALEDRRRAITSSLQERALLTDELERKLAAAETLATLEDIYQPFRPKRRTRGCQARERGLARLAE